MMPSMEGAATSQRRCALCGVKAQGGTDNLDWRQRSWHGRMAPWYLEFHIPFFPSWHLPFLCCVHTINERVFSPPINDMTHRRRENKS